mgnify:CR=1 FL=1
MSNDLNIRQGSAKPPLNPGWTLTSLDFDQLYSLWLDRVAVLEGDRTGETSQQKRYEELMEVEDGGLMAQLGAEIDALVLRIEADGEALVELAVIQDLETMTKEDTFNCTAQNGQIQPDDRAAISYEVLGEDEIRLTDPEGVIVRMKRTEPDTTEPANPTQ